MAEKQKDPKIQKSKDPKKASKQVVKKTSVKKSDSSLTVDVIDMKGKKSGTVSLPKELFGVPANPALIAQAIRVYLINQRQSSAQAQTRGEVTGSRKKIWRQKGTGRARHGDRYAGIFVGGGKAHGPRLRNFVRTMSRAMKRKALATALSVQFAQNNIIVVDGIEKIEPKTKRLVDSLKHITNQVTHARIQERMLIATPGTVANVYRAGKNVDRLTIRDAALLTTYDVMNHKKIIMSKQALEQLTEAKKS